MKRLHRFQSALPAHAKKTYAIKQPTDTHTRPASCAEVECGAYLHGWETHIDEATELGQFRAHYIRKESGRGFTEHRDGAITVFRFEPGQRCFAWDEHRAPLGKPPLFVVRGGDWRGNPRGDVRRHVNADDWLDDFANHQDRLADRLKEG